MKIGRHVTALAAIFGLLALAACGDDGDDNPTPGGRLTQQPLASAAAVALTGAQVPQETTAVQTARAPGIHGRTDSLLTSNIYGETDDPDYPTYVATASCTGTGCTLTHPALGADGLVLGKDDLDLPGEGDRPILTKAGITMLAYQRTDYRSYSAWMAHSFFSVEAGRTADEVGWYTIRVGAAGGDLTDTRPGGDTTWTGIMVGTAQTGAAKGNMLQGDAALTFDPATNQLDAAFTNIKDLDLGAAHSATGASFEDIPVAEGGTYSGGTQGNLIRGGFYGTDHAETAGVFEQAGIVGAFGAKKQ